MKYTISLTDIGCDLLDGDGKVVASFAGDTEHAYNDAVAHLGTLVTRDRAQVAAEAETGDGVTTDDGLLPEHWMDDGGIAFRLALPGGRDFTECEWSWRDPEACLVPLMLQTANEGGHWGAELAGFVVQFALSDDGGTVSVPDGRFYDNEAGRSFRDLLLDGRKFGVSVDPSEDVEAEFVCTEMDEYGWCDDGIYKFMSYEIAGLTGVPFPGFENAAVKLAASNRIMFVRNGIGAIKLSAAASADTNLPLSAQDAEWDAAAADTRVREWADATEEPNAAYGSAFFWTEGEGATFDDFGLPFADVINGELTAVWAGVQEAAANVGDNEDVKPSIEAYYAMAATQYDDDTIEVPWAETAAEDANPDDESEAAASIRASFATDSGAPPRAWFELPEPVLGVEWLDGQLGDDLLVPQRAPRVENGRVVGLSDEIAGMAVPFTITDDRQVFGHLTYWGQCHVGNPWGAGRCASAPASRNEYADFYGSGYVVTDDGSELSCGLLHVGCEHSVAMDVRGVRDAAAHAGLAFAQVRVTDGQYGPWLSGALLPTVTPEQIIKLRALTLSGEWAPELGAVIAVNDGGLPLQRVDRIAASNGATFPVANRVMRASVKGDEITKLIGGNVVHRCAECAKRQREMRAAGVDSVTRNALGAIEAQLDTVIRQLDAVERRTRHMNSAAAQHELAQLQRRQS